MFRENSMIFPDLLIMAPGHALSKPESPVARPRSWLLPVHVGTWDLGAQLNGPGINGFSMDSYGTHMGSLWFYMVLGGFIWFLGGFIWDQYGFLVGG